MNNSYHTEPNVYAYNQNSQYEVYFHQQNNRVLNHSHSQPTVQHINDHNNVHNQNTSLSRSKNPNEIVEITPNINTQNSVVESYNINRATSATARWLAENYEVAENMSLPRSLLYYHYLKHCMECKIDAINSASFGKLIRTVFVGLKTRRLGTRGNSKYHYYGIRVNPSSPLAQIPYDEYIQNSKVFSSNLFNNTNTSTPATNNFKRPNESSTMNFWWNETQNLKNQTPALMKNGTNDASKTGNEETQVPNPSNFIQYISPCIDDFIDFPDISFDSYQNETGKKKDATTYKTSIMDEESSSNQFDYNQYESPLLYNEMKQFVELYRFHCEVLLELISTLQFQSVEKCLNDFWSGNFNGSSNSTSFQSCNQDSSNRTNNNRQDITIVDLGTDNNSNILFNDVNIQLINDNQLTINDQTTFNINSIGFDVETKLSFDQIMKIVKNPMIVQFIYDADFILYQKMIGVLLPNVLRLIPSGLTQLIRTFARNIENWVANCMNTYTSPVVNVKNTAVNAFSQTIRRKTSLNHLSQAVRSVLSNNQQISLMLNDLNRVDINSIIEQAKWTCGSSSIISSECIISIVDTFKSKLLKQVNLEELCSWISEEILVLFESLLHIDSESLNKNAQQEKSKINDDQSNSNVSKSAMKDLNNSLVQKYKDILLGWSYYGGLIIRDLTLRSASSFGSFHLIRLLFDEYLFYLVECKLSKIMLKSPLLIFSNSLYS